MRTEPGDKPSQEVRRPDTEKARLQSQEVKHRTALEHSKTVSLLSPVTQTLPVPGPGIVWGN